MALEAQRTEGAAARVGERMEGMAAEAQMTEWVAAAAKGVAERRTDW